GPLAVRYVFVSRSTFSIVCSLIPFHQTHESDERKPTMSNGGNPPPAVARHNRRESARQTPYGTQWTRHNGRLLPFIFLFLVSLVGQPLSAAEPRTILFFGDSLTAGYGLADPAN